MSDLIQILIGGLSIGAIYASVALGFTLTWRAASVINFAQGDVVMVGAFLGLTFSVIWHWSFPHAFIAAFAVASGLGFLIERVLLRPVMHAELWATVVVTVGLSELLSNLARIIWGPEPNRFPSVFGSAPITLGSVRLIPQALGVLAVVLVLVVALELFFRKTMTGLAMRAVANDRQTATLMSINSGRLIGLTIAISFGLAAVAGILLAPTYFVSFNMGLPIGIRAFAAAIIGGFGSVRGSILGGLLLGVLEAITSAYVSSEYLDAIVFGLVIVVLLVRPSGLVSVAKG
jgi:branched-chain amino acid transport system permease protein